MDTVYVNPEELKAAGIVAENATIKEIRLRTSSIENGIATPSDSKQATNFYYRWDTSEPETPKIGQLMVQVSLEVIFAKLPLEGEDNQGLASPAHTKDLAKVRMTYELHYTLPEAPVPESIERMGGIAAFARWNSVYTAWPFFRQELDHICSVALLPRIPLPLIKLMPKRSEKTE